nr:MAG TPA: hypothetical protein [Caudoviricetes sp.]
MDAFGVYVGGNADIYFHGMLLKQKERHRAAQSVF